MVSARRNELLAELFQRSHRIEKWGRGIKMILEREPATEFEEIGTVQFVTTFKRNSYELTKPDRDGENVGETSQKSSQKSSQKIIDLIREDRKITIEELSKELGISDRAVKNSWRR
jgi:ATP-dependent DNA helicase RecG